ncbi:hypothetical protein D3Z09_11095 [Rahnella aquatilis]|nr:hypothetical protein D3Z09_11095 [Rahnella aquatilis]
MDARHCTAENSSNYLKLSSVLQQRLSPSYFKSQMRWLRLLTRITYLCKLIGTRSLAAFLQLELFRGIACFNHI